MARIDKEKAFGKIDPGFEARVRLTMASLKKTEEQPMKKMKFGLGLAVALCVLLAGLALAAGQRWGLLDFFDKSEIEHMAPEALDLIEPPTDQVQRKEDQAIGSITVREILFDGMTAKIVVNLKPNREKVLFGAPDTNGDQPLSDLGKRFSDETVDWEEDESADWGGDDSMTIGEYAEQQGITTIYAVNWYFPDSPLDIHSIGNQMEDDDSMTYILTATAEEAFPETSTVTLRCRLHDYAKDEMIDEHISFTLNNSSADKVRVVKSGEPVVYEACGMRIDSVTLTGSAMGVKAVILFAIVDQEKYAAIGECAFTVVDKEGNKLPMDLGDWTDGWGGAMVGDISSEDWWTDWSERWGLEDLKEGEDLPPAAYEDMPIYTLYEQETTLPAQDPLPGEITLAVYDEEEDRIYEMKTIPLN